MKKMDVVHHRFHACARVPATAAGCLQADINAEIQLVAAFQALTLFAQRTWQENFAESVGALDLVEFERPAMLPVSPIVCPVCQLKVGLEIASDQLESALRIRSQVPIGVKMSLSKSHAWNYKLEDYFP